MIQNLLADAAVQPEINLREEGSKVLPFGENMNKPGDTGSVVFSIISSLLTVVAIVAGVLLLVNLIYAGIQWIAAGGDSGKLEKARNRIMHSIVGFVIFVSAISIFMLIQNLLNIELLKFSYKKQKRNITSYTCCTVNQECVGFIGNGEEFGCTNTTRACESCK